MLRDKAIAILKDPESFGISLSLACDALTNGAHAAWEFDTLLTYLDEIGCLPDEEARDRLLAVTAIRLCPSHLWDYKVYNNLMEWSHYSDVSLWAGARNLTAAAEVVRKGDADAQLWRDHVIGGS